MEYNWIFNEDSFQCVKSLNGLTDVVECIHWRYEARNGDVSGSIGGSNGFQPPYMTAFIPFQDLTKEQVISWLEENNDMQQLKDAAEHEYNRVLNSSNQVLLPPPFAN